MCNYFLFFIFIFLVTLIHIKQNMFCWEQRNQRERHELKESETREPYDATLNTTTMSQNGSFDHRPRAASNGEAAAAVAGGSNTLRASPKRDHKPDNYEDLQLDFNPLVLSSLERYLPLHMLNMSRDSKAQYMRNILLRYLPDTERVRVSTVRKFSEVPRWVVEFGSHDFFRFLKKKLILILPFINTVRG